MDALHSSSDPAENDVEDERHWYCVHAKAKSEHIASAFLRQLADEDEMEVFCPRIRYQKKTKRGLVWFHEALFPGYTFARFDIGKWLRAVNGTNGVLGIVRFGTNYPPLPAEVVAMWKETVDAEEIVTIDENLEPGDEIEVVSGPMAGMKTVITKVLPGQERVNILMEMLGQDREIEVSRSDIRTKDNIRLRSEKTAG